MSAPSTYPPTAPVSTGPPPNMVTSPRSKRPRPPDLHTGSGSGLPATTGAPISSGPASAGFTPASASGGDDVFHQEDGEDGEDDDDEETPRKGGFIVFLFDAYSSRCRYREEGWASQDQDRVYPRQEPKAYHLFQAKGWYHEEG